MSEPKTNEGHAAERHEHTTDHLRHVSALIIDDMQAQCKYMSFGDMLTVGAMIQAWATMNIMRLTEAHVEKYLKQTQALADLPPEHMRKA